MKNYLLKSSIIGFIIYVIATYLIFGPWLDTLLTSLIFNLIYAIPAWLIITFIIWRVSKSKLPSWVKGALYGGIVYVLVMAFIIFGSIAFGGDSGSVAVGYLFLIMPSMWILKYVNSGSNIISGYILFVDVLMFCLIGGIIGYFMPKKNTK